MDKNNRNVLLGFLGGLLLGSTGSLSVIALKNKLYKTVEWKNTKYGIGDYGNSTPVKVYDYIVKKFGNPDFIDQNRGGLAIWYSKKLEKKKYIYLKIEVKDEQIFHDQINKHVDSLYVYFDIEIHKHLINDVMKISDAIMYDKLKKNIIIRCHDLDRINILFLFIIRFITNEMTIKDIHENHEKYISDEESYIDYMDEIFDYIKKEKDKKNTLLFNIH